MTIVIPHLGPFEVPRRPPGMAEIFETIFKVPRRSPGVAEIFENVGCDIKGAGNEGETGHSAGPGRTGSSGFKSIIGHEVEFYWNFRGILVEFGRIFTGILGDGEWNYYFKKTVHNIMISYGHKMDVKFVNVFIYVQNSAY
jgi:hypothetical protein